MSTDLGIPDRLRLPIAFDVDALLPEVRSIPDDAWTPHFNTQQYEGMWSGVALRAAVGASLELYPDPMATEYVDTPTLVERPALRRALGSFGCPLLTVRLLRLDAGSRILEHRDHKLSFADGEARLHVPLLADPENEFVLDDRPVPMGVGECWYLDLTKRHRAWNPGPGPRIHLVVDAVVDDWLRRVASVGRPGDVVSARSGDHGERDG